jgi:ribosomal protein S18 acetylase RimI-like enzyme
VDDDTPSLIASNVSTFLLTMGRIGGGRERDEQEITWTIGGSPIGYHNAVVHCDASEDRAEDLVEQWRDELRARALPGSWHLTPGMRPTTLPRLLESAGFVDAGDEPAMAAALANLDTTPPFVDDLEIGIVQTSADLEAYRRVLASGFGEGPREADWVTSVFEKAGVGGKGQWRHFVGRLGTEPVTTASLLLDGVAGGIYFVCTTPDHRRRGFGAALTQRAMLTAASEGAKFAVLGSSPMGQRIYERLGFETVFSYRLYEFEP